MLASGQTMCNVRTTVVADSREKESKVRDALLELGALVEVVRLSTGDYRTGAALIERKSVRDLHISIIQDRFWRQVGGLTRTSMHPYLLIEGRELDDGPLRPSSVRGALLAVEELGVGVIRSTDPADSARSSGGEAMLAAVPGISTVIARALIDRFGSPSAVFAATPDEWLSVHGVGPKRSQALLAALGRDNSSPSRAPRARRGLST
jgi:ERCC4-type nuclease